MPSPEWKQRFLMGTRGRILSLLRRTERTVNDLAGELDVSDNTVREHLASLERDGLVRQHGLRRGLRKPHFSYQLTPEAEQFFLEACDPVLGSLLSVLSRQIEPETVGNYLKDAGHHLAQRYLPGLEEAEQAQRLQRAVEALRDLGSLVECNERDNIIQLEGLRCPLAGLVSQYPQVCLFAQALLSEIAGIPVEEHCERGISPHCRFKIPLLPSVTHTS
jgi:predicted ArsR family transcriptional regulator